MAKLATLDIHLKRINLLPQDLINDLIFNCQLKAEAIADELGNSDSRKVIQSPSGFDI